MAIPKTHLFLLAAIGLSGTCLAQTSTVVNPAAEAESKAPSIAVPRCTALPVKTQMHGTAVVGQRLYVFGGDVGGIGWNSKVFSAAIQPAGMLGEWRPERELPERRLYLNASVEVVNNRVYLLAGSVADSADTVEKDLRKTQDVLWTTVQQDGALAEWKRSEPFPGEAISFTASCSTDKHLYIVSGMGDGSPSPAILRAELDATGMPVKWSECGVVPAALWFHGAALLDDRMYVWGGLPTTKAATVNERVWSAQVGADGSVGGWTDETPMPVPVYSSAFCGFNDYLVSVGGRYAEGFPTHSIWYARLENKRVGQWQLINTDLDARVFHSLGLDEARGIVFITGGQKRIKPGKAKEPPIVDSVQAFRILQPKDTRLDMADAPAASMDAALAQARTKGAKVLAFLYSPEVPACRRFHDNVVSKPEFKELAKSHVLTTIDISKQDSTYCYKYSVFKVPALVEVGPGGEALRKAIGVSTLNDVKSFLSGKQ